MGTETESSAKDECDKINKVYEMKEKGLQNNIA
jgi:hypothetical protein